MPHSRPLEREYPRERDYSPESTYSNASDSHYRSNRSNRAVQPYARRDVQPYQNGHSGSRSGYSSPRNARPLARRRSDSYLDDSQQRPGSKKDKAQGFFKEHGGELIGAAVGGYAGHKKGDDHLKTAGGAAVGAIGGAIVERYYGKWADKKDDKKVGREVRSSRNERRGYNGYDSSSDEGSDYDSYSDEEPRYARSVDRGRGEGRGRDKTPSGLKDLGRQLKRSISRKRERGRSENRY